MQHVYPNGAFPVMAPLGEALDEQYERYSPSDHGGSDSGSSNTTNSIPSDYETEKFLRDHLRIPEPVLLNLDAIPDDKAKITTLIILSIWSSPEKRLTLKGIYDTIEARFPQRKAANDKPWQVSSILRQQIARVLIDSLPAIHSPQPLSQGNVCL